MTQEHAPELAVPPSLAAEIVAAAEAQHRPPLDLLHEAVRDYLTRQPPKAAKPRRSSAEAAGSDATRARRQSTAKRRGLTRADDPRARVSDFVLDNSVTMRWCFEGGSNDYADDVLRQLETQARVAIVPVLWRYEVSAVLARADLPLATLEAELRAASRVAGVTVL